MQWYTSAIVNMLGGSIDTVKKSVDTVKKNADTLSKR